jgi:thioesterase domain-containing protein
MAQDLGLSTETAGDPQARQQLRLAVAKSFGLPAETLAELPRASANLIRIVQGDDPPVITGDIFFVQARGSDTGSAGDIPGDPQRWRPYIGGAIDSHGIDCGHFEMMKPGPVAEIGSLLAARMRA